MEIQSRYVIRTLTPANGFSAVWAHDQGGKTEIEIRPLDFIAVADVQKHRNGQWIDDYQDIVGVDLGDGFFHVATDCGNCHGIVREGASWTDVMDLLPSELAARVVKPEGKIAAHSGVEDCELINF